MLFEFLPTPDGEVIVDPDDEPDEEKNNPENQQQPGLIRGLAEKV